MSWFHDSEKRQDFQKVKITLQSQFQSNLCVCIYIYMYVCLDNSRYAHGISCVFPIWCHSALWNISDEAAVVVINHHLMGTAMANPLWNLGKDAWANIKSNYTLRLWGFRVSNSEAVLCQYVPSTSNSSCHIRGSITLFVAHWPSWQSCRSVGLGAQSHHGGFSDLSCCNIANIPKNLMTHTNITYINKIWWDIFIFNDVYI